MTTKQEWLELSERCKKATGPDREIGNAISTASGNDSYLMQCTASIDCAVALIRLGLPGCEFTVSVGGKGSTASWVNEDGAMEPWFSAEQPALALCAAFCRAMAEKDGT